MISAFLEDLEKVFSWLVEASWQASVLVVVILIIQRTFRSRLNSRWIHALWLLVIARLLLPALPESAFSLFQLAPPPPPVIIQSVTAPIFAPVVPGSADDFPAPSPLSAPAHPISIWTIFALIWLIGALGLLVLTLQVNRRFSHQVRRARPIDDPELLQVALAAQAELGLHRSLRVIESTYVQGPVIMGLFRPTVILPQNVRALFTYAELRFIFLHEFAHMKRGDLILQWLVAILQIVHWFNPVLWYGFRCMRTDRETATDALVLSRAGETQKQNYGQVLVKLLEHYHQRHSLTTLIGVLEDKDQFKRRFLLIGRFTRGAYGWSSFGVILLLALAVACLTRAHSASVVKTEPAARIDFEISGKPIALSNSTQESALHLLHELLVMRYINGTPDDIFHWQNLPGSSVEQIKNSGSFLHIVYLKKPSIRVGTRYSYKPDEIWIGLQDSSGNESYPGYPAGIQVVTSGSYGTFDLMFGSKSLLTGLGLLPGILPHLSAAMQKSLEANSDVYPHYVDWMSAKDASGRSINLQVITAVQASDIATLQKLSAQGIDIMKVKGRNPTLLFDAASPEVAEFLIQHGADVNAVNFWGGTALTFAVRSSSPNAGALTRVLLEHGADSNRSSSEMQTTPVLEAYRGETLDALVEHGANLKAIDRDGYGVMFYAGRCDVSYLQSLIRHGIGFDPNRDGPTVMVQAAWINNLPVVQWLLDHGVDPNTQGLWVRNKNAPDDLMFPLQAALIPGQAAVTNLLLDHGARWIMAMAISLQNHHSDTVKLLWEHGDRDISKLCYEISQGAPLGDLQKILERGGPVNPPEDWVVTPLAEAAETDNFPAVQLLVQHGADVNQGGSPVAERYEFHDTPLVLAAERGREDIVAFLLKHGAQANPNAVSGAANGGIPSSFYVGKDHLPSKEHYERAIQVLIDAGALKAIGSNWSGRLLVQAVSPCWGDPDPQVLQMLLAAGLSPDVQMPFLEERGEKPNTVIGYYRDFYAKNKTDPSSVAALKPLLDMMEAKVGGKSTSTGNGHSPDSTVSGQTIDPVKKDGPARPAVIAKTGGLASMTQVADSADDKERHIQTAMMDVARRLKLTRQQTGTIKAAIEAVLGGNVTKSVDQVVREICDTQQVAAWEQILSADLAERAKEHASFESKRIADLLGLDSTKQSKIDSALYSVQLQSVTAMVAAHSAADYFALDSTRLRESDAVLEKILTQDQLSILRSDRERQADAVADNLTEPIDFKATDFHPSFNSVAEAKLPSFSLTGS